MDGPRSKSQDTADLFRQIVQLPTGEALVFCPMALLTDVPEPAAPPTPPFISWNSNGTSSNGYTNGNGARISNGWGNDPSSLSWDTTAIVDGGGGAPFEPGDLQKQQQGASSMMANLDLNDNKNGATNGTDGGGDVAADSGSGLEIKGLGAGYMRLRVRKRITADGGRSILA